MLLLRTEGIIHADIKPENCFMSMHHEHDHPSDEDAQKVQVSNLHINSLETEFLEIRLGDFGNSIHISEIPQYYSEFGIQSLPYRAPEVLLGLPFTAAIDMWSLGVMLVELCTGTPLFVGRSREDMLEQISHQLAPLCPVTFSGGMYSHLLSEISSRSNSNSLIGTPHSVHHSSTNSYTTTAHYNYDSSRWNAKVGDTSTSGSCSVPFSYTNHLSCVKRLLTHALPSTSHSLLSSDFLHFIGGLLMPDPKLRLSPVEALAHPFLCDSLAVPLHLLVGGCWGEGGAGGGGGAGATAGHHISGGCSNRHFSNRSSTASIRQLRRLTVSTLEPREVKPSSVARASAVVAVKREEDLVLAGVKTSGFNNLDESAKMLEENRKDTTQLNEAPGRGKQQSEVKKKDTTDAGSAAHHRGGTAKIDTGGGGGEVAYLNPGSSGGRAGAGSASRGQSGNNSLMALFSPPTKAVVSSSSSFARLQSSLQSSLLSSTGSKRSSSSAAGEDEPSKKRKGMKVV